ncbi:hypothetical protein [Embleya sp. MST-111070]
MATGSNHTDASDDTVPTATALAVVAGAVLLTAGVVVLRLARRNRHRGN